jgi:hypothetical protein
LPIASTTSQLTQVAQFSLLDAVIGVAGAVMVPDPAFHFRMCRADPVDVLSTNASLVPSMDSATELEVNPPVMVDVPYAK